MEIQSDVPNREPLDLELIKNQKGWLIKLGDKVWGPRREIPHYFGNREELKKIYQALEINEDRWAEFNQWLLFSRINIRDQLDKIDEESCFQDLLGVLHVPPEDEPLLRECPICNKSLAVTNAVDSCGIYMVECRDSKCRFCVMYLLNKKNLRRAIRESFKYDKKQLLKSFGLEKNG